MEFDIERFKKGQQKILFRTVNEYINVVNFLEKQELYLGETNGEHIKEKESDESYFKCFKERSRLIEYIGDNVYTWYGYELCELQEEYNKYEIIEGIDL